MDDLLPNIDSTDSSRFIVSNRVRLTPAESEIDQVGI